MMPGYLLPKNIFYQNQYHDKYKLDEEPLKKIIKYHVLQLKVKIKLLIVRPRQRSPAQNLKDRVAMLHYITAQVQNVKVSYFASDLLRHHSLDSFQILHSARSRRNEPNAVYRVSKFGLVQKL